ncbi:hypothetical protein JW960_15385 [candidate division KSB1 bacterium]|nr:hypothetical protein [candidate division KSB1 bacterium]
MNRHIILIMVLTTIILLPASIHAKVTKYIGVGATRATLRTEGGNSEMGHFLGLGLEYSRPNNLLFAIEGIYATKKTILENKRWPATYENYTAPMVFGDLLVGGSFVECFIKVGYQIPLYKNRASIKIYCGPGFSRQTRGAGSSVEHDHLWYDEWIGRYEFDYLRSGGEGTRFHSRDFIIGSIISYRGLGFEIRYASSSTEQKSINSLTIDDKLDTLYFILCYGF